MHTHFLEVQLDTTNVYSSVFFIEAKEIKKMKQIVYMSAYVWKIYKFEFYRIWPLAKHNSQRCFSLCFSKMIPKVLI